MIRPSLILQMNLDESVYDEEVVAEIKRSYSYVAPTTVTGHETGAGKPENTMRFLVRIHRPYWRHEDDGADELWDEVMLKWLKNMVYKVSSTMVAYNRVRRESGQPQLIFDWLEVEFSDMVLSMRLNADCSLEEHGAVELADRVRTLANDGVFGEGVSCVRVPSRASYEAQAAQAAASSAETGEGADDGQEPPSEGEGQAEDAAEAEDGQGVEEPGNFDIDTTLWGIEYADGSEREFDSAVAAFVS